MPDKFKATVDAKAFSALASRICDVVGRSTIPILSHAWMRIEGGRLYVTSTDLSRGLTMDMEADGEGSVTAPALGLLRLGAVAKSGSIDFALDSMVLRCRNDAMTHNLPTLPVADFPTQIADAVSGKGWEVSAETLRAALHACVGAMETGKVITWYAHGAYFKYGKEPRVYATDRLVMVRIALPGLEDNDEGGFIVPTEAIGIISDLCDGGDVVKIALPDRATAASFSCGIATLRTSLIDGNPPDYEKIIPKSFATKVSANSKALLSALVRATPFDEGARRTMAVGIEPEKSALEFQGAAAMARDECQIFDGEGPASKFGMTPEQVKWAVSGLKSETVTIHSNGLETPVMFTGSDGDHIRIAVASMP